LSRIYKLAQHTLIAHPLVAEQDDIDRHVILLQLLPQLDQRLFTRRLGSRGRRRRRVRIDERGSEEDDDSLSLVLVLSVFEGELGDVEGGGEVDVASDVILL